jgi:hypothetical protein
MPTVDISIALLDSLMSAAFGTDKRSKFRNPVAVNHDSPPSGTSPPDRLFLYRRKDWRVDPARARSSYNWKPQEEP